jgi:hypothetical protein
MILNMNSNESALEMGMLICKHCGEIVGTLDTEKVSTLHVDCKKEACKETRIEKISFIK